MVMRRWWQWRSDNRPRRGPEGLPGRVPGGASCAAAPPTSHLRFLIRVKGFSGPAPVRFAMLGSVTFRPKETAVSALAG
ncbi:hypothetical protein GCM10020221_32870 [Streptomyces thioluteus]|uniref:Uncharacterized protein n=1 Tax=Streptomyces thioluteus TaxID=66431 RepID=A0ABN3X1T0_STRTU